MNKGFKIKHVGPSKYEYKTVIKNVKNDQLWEIIAAVYNSLSVNSAEPQVL